MVKRKRAWRKPHHKLEHATTGRLVKNIWHMKRMTRRTAVNKDCCLFKVYLLEWEWFLWSSTFSISHLFTSIAFFHFKWSYISSFHFNWSHLFILNDIPSWQTPTSTPIYIVHILRRSTYLTTHSTQRLNPFHHTYSTQSHSKELPYKIMSNSKSEMSKSDATRIQSGQVTCRCFSKSFHYWQMRRRRVVETCLLLDSLRAHNLLATETTTAEAASHLAARAMQVLVVAQVVQTPKAIRGNLLGTRSEETKKSIRRNKLYSNESGWAFFCACNKKLSAIISSFHDA